MFGSNFLPGGRLRRPDPAPSRRVRAYCVGTAKSGTHSLAGVFSAGYVAAHEAAHGQMIRAIFARAASRLDSSQAERFIRDRDRRLGLEMDSSQLNCPFVDVMARVFPEARFILTLRDCYSFLHSITNHTLARPASQSWRRFRDFRFGGHEHSLHEQVLADRGLYTLDGYLSYWANHTHTAIREIPPDRLLVVRTREIRDSIPRIAGFLNLDPASLDAGQAHAYPAIKRFGVISQIDPHYVEDKVRQHCGDLMRRFYPELLTAADAGFSEKVA